MGLAQFKRILTPEAADALVKATIAKGEKRKAIAAHKEAKPLPRRPLLPPDTDTSPWNKMKQPGARVGTEKFWHARVVGNVLTTKWGVIGKTEQAKPKTFDTKSEAIAALHDLIREKTVKGYKPY